MAVDKDKEGIYKRYIKREHIIFWEAKTEKYTKPIRESRIQLPSK